MTLRFFKASCRSANGHTFIFLQDIVLVSYADFNFYGIFFEQETWLAARCYETEWIYICKFYDVVKHKLQQGWLIKTTLNLKYDLITQRNFTVQLLVICTLKLFDRVINITNICTQWCRYDACFQRFLQKILHKFANNANIQSFPFSSSSS